MRNIFIRYIKGYVKIRLESSMPERFINLCAKNQIDIWNLMNEDMYYICEISIKDFFRLAPFRRKTSAHIAILEKHGLPFFLQFAQKRKAFFLGIFLFCAILYSNSGILWDIRINGNTFYSDETILEELDSIQVNSGMPKNNLNCKDIAAQIRNTFPKVVWVSVKLEGCCLILDIKENENPNAEEISHGQSWNLITERAGEIVKIVTRTGVPLVTEGTLCEEGDVLVRGSVEILNQDLQVQRISYVGADADIQIKTKHAYYDEFSLTYQTKIYTKTNRTFPFLRLGNTEWSLIPKLSENQELFFEEIPLFLTNSLPLPISCGWTTIRTYQTDTQTYSKEEAQTIAQQNLQNHLEEMVIDGMTILDKDLQFTISGNTAYYKGYIEVIESPIVKQYISEMSQPIENSE